MLRTLKLLLPALVPSWRFFRTIEPSPRVEWAMTRCAEEVPAMWREFRPRPKRIALSGMARRMVWNPQRNEALFLVSCAERLMEGPDPHAHEEIFRRIEAGLLRTLPAEALLPCLHFRLVFISREGTRLERAVTYLSHPRRMDNAAAK